MEGVDNPGVFFSDNFASGEGDQSAESNLSTKKSFKEFLRQFSEDGFHYRYRDDLKRRYNLGQYWVEVNVQDLSSFDEKLADRLRKNPTEMLPLFEEAATEVADEVIY